MRRSTDRRTPAAEPAALPRAAGPTCACASADGEPLAGPAPEAAGWVLLEHPGPWGPEPAEQSPLVPAAVRRAVAQRGLRLNLVRAHRQRPGLRPNACFLVSSAAADPFVERLHLADPVELLPHALDALADGRPSGLGTRIARPLYLICAHGRKEVGCARQGRPIAQAVTALVGARAWETTHVGGCRFAANLVCLPTGIYYSRVAPSDVASVVAATEAGRIALPWYRGRADTAAPAQIADSFLRRLTGIDGIDAVRAVRQPPLAGPGGDLHPVDVTTGWGRYRVLLRTDAPSRRPGCDHRREAVPATYRVVSVVELD